MNRVILIASLACFMSPFFGSDNFMQNCNDNETSAYTAGAKSFELGGNHASTSKNPTLFAKEYLGQVNVSSLLSVFQQQWDDWLEGSTREGIHKRTGKKTPPPYRRSQMDCQTRAEATFIVLSYDRGHVFVSWTEICEFTSNSGGAFYGGEPGAVLSGEVGCKSTYPTFGYGHDKMVLTVPNLLNNVIGEMCANYGARCVAFFYRYVEIDRVGQLNSRVDLNDTVTKIWPAVQ